MTDKQKEDFGHWLINNLQFTSVSNVQLIIDHVDRYLCQSPSGANVLVEALEKIAKEPTISEPDPTESDVEEKHDEIIQIARKALAQYKSQPGSLQGEQESINFLEWVGKEGWKWSELNSRWFKYGSDDYLNETQLHEKFKERDVTEEHKSDREPEETEIEKLKDSLGAAKMALEAIMKGNVIFPRTLAQQTLMIINRE